VEYIEQKPVKEEKEVGKFYYRGGVLLGLVYALGGNDFHCENLIAWGAHPVLIDLETLLLHRVRPFQLTESEQGLDGTQKALNMLGDSVLRTGLLPVWRMDGKGNTQDIGALTASNDRMKNLPLYQGEKQQSSRYREEILQGFASIYDFLLQHRDTLLEASPFRKFQDCRFRFLIRSTQIYADLLDHTTHPAYLRSGLDYSFELERMGSAYLLSAPAAKLKELWKIFLSERDALEQRDIPVFFGDAGDLAVQDYKGYLYGQYFWQNATDRAQDLLKGMNPQDKKLQMNLILSLFIYA